jgi:Leucine-rich repeat (LRR) protein
VGLEGVPNLKKLNLRHNKIDKIDGGGEDEKPNLPDLPALEYLNLRTNGIASI